MGRSHIIKKDWARRAHALGLAVVVCLVGLPAVRLSVPSVVFARQDDQSFLSFLIELEQAEKALKNFHLNVEETYEVKGEPLAPDWPKKMVTSTDHTYQDGLFRVHKSETAVLGNGEVRTFDDFFAYDGQKTRTLLNGYVGNVTLGRRKNLPVMKGVHSQFTGLSRVSMALSEFLRGPEAAQQIKVRMYVQYLGKADLDSLTCHHVRLTSYDPENPAERASFDEDGTQIRHDIFLNCEPGLWPARYEVAALNANLEVKKVQGVTVATGWKVMNGIHVATGYSHDSFNVPGTPSRISTLSDFSLSVSFGPEYFGMDFPKDALVYVVNEEGEIIYEMKEQTRKTLGDLTEMVAVENKQKEQENPAEKTSLNPPVIPETPAVVSGSGNSPKVLLAVLAVLAVLAIVVVYRSRKESGGRD